MKRFVGVLAIAALSACNEMSDQPRYDHDKPGALFADGKSLQAPPEGSVAQDDPSYAAELANRPTMSLTLLQRGRDRYGIFCVPCHDEAGTGHGTAPARGFPQPPSFGETRLRAAKDAYFVDVITNGHGVMYSYADRVRPADRWAIAAYIRALQVSQESPSASSLSPGRTQPGAPN